MTHRFEHLQDELRRVLREARWVLTALTPEQKRKLRIAMVLMAIGAFANSIGPLLIGRTVDSILHGEVRTMLTALPWLAALGAVYIFREAVTVVRRIVVEQAATNVEKSMLLQVVKTTFRADLTAIGEERVGATHSRLRRSVDGVVRYVKLSFLDFVPAVANAIFAIAAALYQQPVVGALLILIVPVGGYIVLRQLASQRGVRLRLIKTREMMDGTIVEQLTGMEAVRAANTIGRELERTAIVAEQLRSDEMRHHKAMAMFDALKSLNEGFFHVALLTVAIALNVRNVISTGDVLTFSILFLATVTPLREIHRILDEAHESSLLVEQLRGILQQPADISFTTPDAAITASGDNDVIISAKHVSAGYREGGDVKPVLADVSFEIKPGEIVGIAGASGCGKSTALRVLLRLTHPNGGALHINGVPVSDMSREAIAREFGFVGQTPFLFAGTVFENIAYERPDASAEEVYAAAMLAHVSDDILRMKDGYQSRVAERGQNLSGGQRQRIALARAFLKQAPILVLDEATSALDNITESAVLRAIRNMRVQSVIMVAHRMSSLRSTDRILVFDRGSLAESGTFDELASRGGAFSRLLQASGHESPAAAVA